MEPDCENAENSQILKPKILNLELKKLDETLLQDYLTSVDNESSALHLRFQLLKLELNELEEHKNKSHIFGNEVNILSQRDCNKPRNRSKTKKHRKFKSDSSSNLAFTLPSVPNVRIFLEDEDTFIPSPKLDDFEELENTETLKKADESIKSEDFDNAIDNSALPEIKLEVEVENCDEKTVKPENQNISVDGQPRRKRGRPRKKLIGKVL